MKPYSGHSLRLCLVVDDITFVAMQEMLRFGFWNLPQQSITMAKLRPLGQNRDHFWIFLGLLVIVFMKMEKSKKRVTTGFYISKFNEIV